MPTKFQAPPDVPTNLWHALAGAVSRHRSARWSGVDTAAIDESLHDAHAILGELLSSTVFESLRFGEGTTPFDSAPFWVMVGHSGLLPPDEIGPALGERIAKLVGIEERMTSSR